MRRLCACSLLTCLLVGQATAQVIDELRDSQSLIQTRVVPREDLTLARAVRLGTAFMSDGPRRKLHVLTMYADSVDAAEEMGGCENSYKQWKFLYDSFRGRSLGAAQLISTSDGAAVSVRSVDGKNTRQLLGGADPTKVEINGVQLQVLFIAGRTRSRFERCSAGAVEPVLFLETSTALTIEFCKRATSGLARAWGVSHLWASFRNDIWFLCTQFPVFYPFSAHGPVPPEAAYRGSRQFTCYLGCDGTPRCGP